MVRSVGTITLCVTPWSWSDPGICRLARAKSPWNTPNMEKFDCKNYYFWDCSVELRPFDRKSYSHWNFSVELRPFDCKNYLFKNFERRVTVSMLTQRFPESARFIQCASRYPHGRCFIQAYNRNVLLMLPKTLWKVISLERQPNNLLIYNTLVCCCFGIAIHGKLLHIFS